MDEMLEWMEETEDDNADEIDDEFNDKDDNGDDFDWGTSEEDDEVEE